MSIGWFDMIQCEIKECVKGLNCKCDKGCDGVRLRIQVRELVSDEINVHIKIQLVIFVLCFQCSGIEFVYPFFKLFEADYTESYTQNMLRDYIS